jgi:hypothetical protein
VRVFWIVHTKGGITEDLIAIERRKAFGIDFVGRKPSTIALTVDENTK